MDDSYYTDAELESATGLPLIHVRRLITWGAVSPAKGGNGRAAAAIGRPVAIGALEQETERLR